MILGFCVVSRTDAMLDADGFCVHHATVAIPPSWGDRRWQWKAGTWQPYKPRPAGHVWVQPTDAPKPARAKVPLSVSKPYPKKPPTSAHTPTRTLTCEQCRKVFETISRGGVPQRYCSRPCKVKATNLQERAARVRQKPTRSCAQCGSAFTPTQVTGTPQRYCSAACRAGALTANRAANRASRTKPAGVGACEVCGTTFTLGVQARRFCDKKCRDVAFVRRRAAERPIRYCRVCAAPVVRKPGQRGRQLDCGAQACRQESARQSALRIASGSMADRGIACVCGHPDRPHRAEGKCNACVLRDRRESKRATPCVSCKRAGLWLTARGMCETCYRHAREQAS